APYKFLFLFQFFLFPSLYLTAAYAMGKHVPGSNLFPTQRVYLSTERVYLPTD
ncbi:hypothetical protein V2W45_1430120, partial [Cenococcum geophilum]